MPYIVLLEHFTCILTETTKMYDKTFEGLKKNPIMISPYCIFEVDKLAHDDFFLILNINHIFNIICPSTTKTHSITYSQ